jgi:hypothetical protein
MIKKTVTVPCNYELKSEKINLFVDKPKPGETSDTIYSYEYRSGDFGDRIVPELQHLEIPPDREIINISGMDFCFKKERSDINFDTMCQTYYVGLLRDAN